MDINNIFDLLEETPVDEKIGIKLIKLTGNRAISVYAGQVAPKTELRAHYHLEGIETYQILSGEGLMKVGHRKGEGIDWNSFQVKAGDCFSVQEGEVHQIINESDSERLLTIFCCPESHTTHDRHFI